MDIDLFQLWYWPALVLILTCFSFNIDLFQYWYWPVSVLILTCFSVDIDLFQLWYWPASVLILTCFSFDIDLLQFWYWPVSVLILTCFSFDIYQLFFYKQVLFTLDSYPTLEIWLNCVQNLPVLRRFLKEFHFLLIAVSFLIKTAQLRLMSKTIILFWCITVRHLYQWIKSAFDMCLG